ncbi:DNA binding domain protein [Rhodococcus phage Weasels2]|uniref:DNA binding domain protein n=1 Tax=Rhodococcus phage Weasels2 TaxID=1897437 RepID=A0A1I9SA96_9CAUD|nr:DNA binding domain protein [Rhodococcus phage Weasels2]AOZ63702.1 DNA binding domain protein [Rhodococcus phage Weasels2]
MSNDELELVYDEVAEVEAEVIKLHNVGKTTSEIQQLTNMPPKVQREILGRFRDWAQNDLATQQRTKEAVAYLDLFFTEKIREMHELYEAAYDQDPQDLKLMKEILKEEANITKMRLDALQKSGLLGANGIGDQLAEIEEQKAAIFAMVKEVAIKFPETQRFIAERIAELSGQVVSHRVTEPEV